MKKVFSPAAQVAHVWAQREQDEGRNSGQTFYFTGDTIYSYGSHFPIARHVDAPGGHCVLFTTDTYGNATAKHLSHTRGAIRHLVSFTIPVDLWDDAEVGGYGVRAYYLEEISDCLQRAKRARKLGPLHLERAQAYRDEANKYAEYFACTWSVELHADATQALEASKQARAELEAEQEKARAERIKKEREACRAEYEAWRRGAHSARCPIAWRPQDGTHLLALIDDEVRTSDGATFPADHAARVWPILQRMYKALEAKPLDGRKPHRFDPPIRIGHFQISAMLSEGTIVAGCHKVPADEVKRVGAMLEAREPSEV